MICYTEKHRVPFLIDAEDFETLRRYTWHTDDRGYICTGIGKAPKQSTVKLHQFILGRAPAGFEWDHRNRDKRDNRRANLRLLTKAQNGQNLGPARTRGRSSQYRGVSYKRSGRWQATVFTGGKQVYARRFPTEAEAAQAASEARKRFLPYSTEPEFSTPSPKVFQPRNRPGKRGTGKGRGATPRH